MKYCKTFLIVFIFGLLISPLFHMNMADKIKQENRTLAKFPEIKSNKKFNYKFGQDFEAWLGDRFGGRKKLINARFKLLYKINGRQENEKAFIGDDGWMFYKTMTYIPSIKEQQEQINKKVKVVKDFVALFNKKNVNFYVLLIPSRGEIYQKYWENHYPVKPRLDFEKEFADALSGLTNVTIVNTKPAIQENINNEDLYWKDDDHLTPNGRYLLSKELYNRMAEGELKNTGNHLSEEKKEHKSYGHVASIAAKLGLSGHTKAPYNKKTLSIKDIEYVEEDGKIFTKAKSKSNLFANSQFLYHLGHSKKPLIHRNLYSLGDCYAEDMYNFLKPLYDRSHWIRTNIKSLYGQDANEYNKNKIKEILKKKEPATIIITLFADDKETSGMLEEIINESSH